MERIPWTRGWRIEPICLLVAALLSLCAVSCAKEPADLEQRARAALERAKNSQAELYAPAAYRSAVDTLGLAAEELAVQSGKFAMARRFDRAEQLLRSATTAAERAEAASVVNMQSTKEEALGTQASLESMRNDLERMLQSPEGQSMLRGRRTGPGMRSLRDDTAEIGESVSNIEEALENQRYHDAMIMARSAKEQASLVHAQVEEAIETGVIPSRGAK